MLRDDVSPKKSNIINKLSIKFIDPATRFQFINIAKTVKSTCVELIKKKKDF